MRQVNHQENLLPKEVSDIKDQITQLEVKSKRNLNQAAFSSVFALIGIFCELYVLRFSDQFRVAGLDQPSTIFLSAVIAISAGSFLAAAVESSLTYRSDRNESLMLKNRLTTTDLLRLYPPISEK